MARRVRHSISFATAVAVIAAALGTAQQAHAALSLNLDAPPLVMTSKAGRHVADQGSFCVDGTQRSVGVSVCADVFELDVTRVSVVRPGEAVRIRLRGARIVHRSRLCGPSRRCPAVVSVAALGCDEVIRRFRLRGSTTSWKVRLEPGAYQLDVFVGRFRARDGRTGRTSGSFGLFVDPAAKRDIVRPADDLNACGR
jgi:hypothetical protein